MSVNSPYIYDVIIIGAGAAGMMCAIEAGKRGRRVLVLDKANKAGRKILISGGGKCNFTNLDLKADNYLSENPFFCRSALSRYSQWDFISLFTSHELSWEEREHGQLFCEQGAKAVVEMLLEECQLAGVSFLFNCDVDRIQFKESFLLSTRQGVFQSSSLVVATGGPSIPRMGATDFGLQIARQFGLKNIPFKSALVPFIFDSSTFKRFFHGLAGISLVVRISCGEVNFREQLLITHKGISGPVVLQISSYWQKGKKIVIDLLPDLNSREWLIKQKNNNPNKELKTLLADILPKRLVQRLCEYQFDSRPMQHYRDKELHKIAYILNHWQLQPSATEGMRTAEAATGGVDTSELSSKSMAARKQPGLFFIGETVDVTGQLGGFNFQWAWSSGWCAGQYV